VLGYAGYLFLTLKNSSIVAHSGDTASDVLSLSGQDSAKAPDASKFLKPGDGRLTLALLGVGGENHPGGTLTDTIQIISIDAINKKAAITSLPRDLYVNPSGLGRMKINAVYTSAEKKKKGSGGEALRAVVTQVTGVKVTNFSLIDFTGLKQIVDALGGIRIDVPRAISDPLYPAEDQIHYSPFFINAGLQTLDGKTALRYVRSRETTSDFDRAARQQLVIAAIKEKALSLGVLTNPIKLNGLVTALGTHFKTDLPIDQLKQIVDIYRQVDSVNATTNVLDTSAKLGLLESTTDPVAGYISYPALGYDKYEAIRDWFASNNLDPLLAKEAPTVTVYGTGKASAKQLTAFVERLTKYGYVATLSPEVAPSKVTQTTLYSQDPNKKAISRNYLGAILSGSVTKGKAINAAPATDFEVVYVPTTVAAAVKPSPKVTARATATPTPTPSPSPTPTPTPLLTPIPAERPDPSDP
jgi:LCP family protein required for cell wall assembly